MVLFFFDPTWFAPAQPAPPHCSPEAVEGIPGSGERIIIVPDVDEEMETRVRRAVEALPINRDCEECEQCVGALEGLSQINTYGDTRPNRRGYAYQHLVVPWFVWSPSTRQIMEWRIPHPVPGQNPVDFDGLDPTPGHMLLAQSELDRRYYDPVGEVNCYLIEAKRGYERAFEVNEEGVLVPILEFMLQSIQGQFNRQIEVLETLSGTTGLLWILSSMNFHMWFKSNISEGVPFVYSYHKSDWVLND